MAASLSSTVDAVADKAMACLGQRLMFYCVHLDVDKPTGNASRGYMLVLGLLDTILHNKLQ